jgi:hypothetical protein
MRLGKLNEEGFHYLSVLHFINMHCGARGGAVGCGTALQGRRSGVRFPMVSLEFFNNIILPAAQWPWG